ncbi:MAG: hypothetical protein A3K19_10255 [Lentisphaerae bacterium RIFOXYB12_FULL_65_16]|nr:MAG: hypothetical protein A3K18_32115 [Lentisphaerae bacterium RIFOXYA12_64_32]OGV91598.1 MAG: hypothetical protein A3K19_10255 [Lentisphaerae bacterium RIFOXYB12_FULL_65_16]
MARMSLREQYRAYVEQWRRAGPELEKFHAEELRRSRYSPADADALLELGDRYDGPPRLASGLVEMQRLFMKAARQQGLLPAEVRESPPAYGSTDAMQTLGNADILKCRNLALLCSVKCPGKLILDAYDFCRHLRAGDLAVISGFHSPMEQECRHILLRSSHPVIWCLARGMLARVPSDLRKPVADGRLLILAPFPDTVRRATLATSAQCNRFVAGLADAVLVVHAAPGSKTEALGLELLAAGKPLFTLDHPANAALIQAGARGITPDTDVGCLIP